MKSILIAALLLTGCATAPSMETYRESVTWMATPTVQYTKVTTVTIRLVDPVLGVTEQVPDGLAPAKDIEL